MEREFIEEAGIIIPKENWIYYGTITDGLEWEVYCYYHFVHSIVDVKSMTDEKISKFRIKDEYVEGKIDEKITVDCPLDLLLPNINELVDGVWLKEFWD